MYRLLYLYPHQKEKSWTDLQVPPPEDQEFVENTHTVSRAIERVFPDHEEDMAMKKIIKPCDDAAENNTASSEPSHILLLRKLKPKEKEANADLGCCTIPINRQ